MDKPDKSQIILIVDDIQENIQVLGGILGSQYRINVARNGLEALKIVERILPDLILLDIMMPEMDGYEVCRRMKANNRTKDIPIIFLTAKTEVEDETKGLELGAVDYITKPILAPIVMTRVRTHLRLKAATDALQKKNDELLRLNHELDKEKQKSDKLLLNILPSRIADQLKEKGSTEPESFENVAVLFSDLADFTKVSSETEPVVLINELNEIFTAFDSVIELNGCERIKTIGDAYMGVCGMPVPNERYADNIVCSAVQVVQFLKKKNLNSSFQWKIRIGIHAGKVVGGIVGVKKYIYDVFGDTVNMASRLQSAAKLYNAEILISDTVYDKINNYEAFHIREIDTVRVKGGLMPIRLYEVFDCDEDIIRENKKKTLSVFNEAILKYKAGNFKEALEKFNICLEICPKDNLPPVYIKRCSTMIRIPPGNSWSGINGI